MKADPGVSDSGFAKGWDARLRLALHGGDPFLLLVICLPFVILAFHGSWIFNCPGHIDPWFSIGYYLDLSDNIRFIKGYYTSTRLACWLPGALVYAIFPPMLANYVLRLAYYLAATLAFYATTSHTLGRKTALIATFALGCYWHFLTEIGHHYVDGAGLTYTLLAFAALAWATDGRRRQVWMALAGFWFAAALLSNMTLGVQALPLAFFHLWGCRRFGRFRLLGWDVLSAVLGFLALGVPLAAYYYHETQIFILAPSLSFFQIVRDQCVIRADHGIVPFQAWFWEARWMDLPLVVLAGSIAFLVLRFFRRGQEERPFAVGYQWCYLLLFGLLGVLQSRWMNLLVYDYYASYLLPVLFLALAALLRPAVDGLRDSTVVVLCLAALGLMAILFRLPLDNGWFHQACLSSVTDYRHVLYVLCATLAAVLAVLWSGATRWRTAKGASLALLLACLAFLNYSRTIVELPRAQYRKDGFRAIMKGVALIHAHGYKPANLVFWYKPANSFDSDLYTSLQSVYLWCFTTYSLNYPELPRDAAGKPVSPIRAAIVILSKQPGIFPEAQGQLRQVGVDARLIEEKRIAYGNCAYTLTLIENRPLVPPLAAIRAGG